jgi:hypothetical protein
LRRRRFDHLFEELSIRIGRLAPRYALWLHLRERGADPDHLTRDEALAFCRDDLEGFLRAHALAMRPRERERLARAVARHDPAVPSPIEWMSAR